MSSGVSSLCKSRPTVLARTTLQAGAGGGNVSEEAGVCGKIALNVYNGGDRRAAAATGDGREKTMRLNEEEKAILAGEMGEPRRLALERSEEHTSELQSLMRISYAVFCLKKKNTTKLDNNINNIVQK